MFEGYSGAVDGEGVLEKWIIYGEGGMFEIRNIDIQMKMIFHFNKSFPKCAAPDKFPTCSRLVGINRDKQG